MWGPAACAVSPAPEREALNAVGARDEAQECFSGKRVTERGRQAEAREEAALSTCLFLRGALCFLLSTQMKKVMLTVFKHNHGAYQFFREALQ